MEKATKMQQLAYCTISFGNVDTKEIKILETFEKYNEKENLIIIATGFIGFNLIKKFIKKRF